MKESDSGRGRRRSRDDQGRGSGGRSRDRQERSGGRSRADSSDETPPAVDEDRLRAAYDLLQAVVADKAGEEGSVRDSEVKRQMVERDADFDEAALGFRKFSRFLRQAHDEEVINLERTPQGNYTVALVEGATAPSAGGDGEKTSGRPAEERRRGRGRQDRKSESRRDRESKPRAEKDSEPRADQDSDRGDDPAEAEEAEASPAPESRAESPSAGPSRSPLAGRKRRSTPSQATAKVVPGPVDSGKDSDSRPAEKQETKAAPPKPSTRTMGRFRRGSRGPGGPASPAATRTAADGAGAGDSDGDASSADEADSSDLVQRMARGYQGVGRRTAERLVDEFGDRVLEVIDHEPEKIEDVLPKGRAQAVIEGRKAELEGDSDPA